MRLKLASNCDLEVHTRIFGSPFVPSSGKKPSTVETRGLSMPLGLSHHFLSPTINTQISGLLTASYFSFVFSVFTFSLLFLVTFSVVPSLVTEFIETHLLICL